MDSKRFRGRDFLRLADYWPSELCYILDTARELKRIEMMGVREGKPLQGKIVALLFEKPSLRTRVSFEVALRQLGGDGFYLGPQEVGLGQREAVKDVAQVLDRMVDGLVIRTFTHENLLEIAHFCSIPVINGLSDLYHPCQVLGDLLTIQEKKGKLRGIKICFLGDGNNVCHSWIEAASLLGLELTVSTPERYRPSSSIWEEAQKRGEKNGARIIYEVDPQKAIEGAEIVYTDVWASMGKEGEKEERKVVLQPYQINDHLLSKASPDFIVMHCMPAKRGEEITDEVMDGPHSVVVDEAENRLHAQKALLALILS